MRIARQIESTTARVELRIARPIEEIAGARNPHNCSRAPASRAKQIGYVDQARVPPRAPAVITSLPCRTPEEPARGACLGHPDGAPNAAPRQWGISPISFACHTFGGQRGVFAGAARSDQALSQCDRNDLA